MYRTAGIAAAMLILASCSASRSQDNSAEFARDKAQMLANMKAQGFKSNAALLCAAKRVSPETAPTMYLVWIHERGDLTTEAQRSAASRDSVESIEACGGDIVALANDLQRYGDDVPKGLALALLEAGR